MWSRAGAQNRVLEEGRVWQGRDAGMRENQD